MIKLKWEIIWTGGLRHSLRVPYPHLFANSPLSINDGDGSENVTRKINTPCFKFLPSYSTSFNCQMLANFSGVEFEKTVPKIKKKEKEKWNRFFVFTSFIKREVRQFHVAVVQQRQRSVQKKTCCQCTVVANLRPRPNVGLFMRQTKLGELSSRKVWRLAQLSSSEWVWVVQRVLSVCFRTEITALACRHAKAEI